ncbi:histidine--tRNA ligase [Mycoplasmopsis mucosicanis]|uniref:Histidine--tRNA ligase n=1 Tax=Mycoplasmopsis mucosicanis TaxID=458208 RepID=A0A507SV77_9BACT|nr:histidine--tRNA ligase [Mycoplasmopsis mucosicanis]TQC54104.1 histidine--tRNA ligase [Mycoplasmopsis mucosicanis]
MINRIKGTRDLGPAEMNLHEYIRSVFVKFTKNYNFSLIDTPIIEQSQLYKRSVAGSDIVKKEMYEFKDKGQRDIALRPEGTAGFVRALIENKWYATLKTPKFAYFGQMFRYEQPQKGRQRQFYQAGVESIGEANVFADAELIILAHNILEVLGVKTTLKINSIGDNESRAKYQDELKRYFAQYKDQLSEDSQSRLENNVLRILDDKVDSQKEFVKKAPKINKFLSVSSQQYFEQLLKILDQSDIKYQIDYSLVRGLDYYDEVVYEFVSNSQKSGSQSTLIGGGRYSKLINELGGPLLSSSGWGFGIDRIAEIMMDENVEITNDDVEVVDILVASTNETHLLPLFNLSNELRYYGVKIEFLKDISKSKKIFDKAKKLSAKFVIFDDLVEQKNDLYLVKNTLNNDKMYFNLTEEGFIDLLEFLADNKLKAIEDLEVIDED